MLIVTLVIATLLITSFVDSPKMSAILAFIFPAAAFQAMNAIINPDYFHLLGGGLDLLVIAMLAVLFRSGWVVLVLAIISGFSIYANYYGWMMYELRQPAVNYDEIFTGIYVFVLLLTIMEWWNVAGASGYHSMVRRFRNFGYKADMENL